MNKLDRIAKSLVAYFLHTGRYEDLGTSDSSGVLPAAAQAQVGAHLGDYGAFAGLSVRAVAIRREPDERCFVYVTRTSKKLEQSLPDELEGVRISVRKVGRMLVRPEAARSSTNGGFAYRDAKGRIACGSSVAPARGATGTMGALLRDKAGKMYALSNNHVLGGCNHTPKGQPILSPGDLDVSVNGPPIVQFAKADRLVELRSGDLAHVPTQTSDAALALVNDSALVTSMQGDSFDTPPVVAPLGDALRVKKVGRTTGLTTGTVEGQVVQVMGLPYRDRKFAATVNFDAVWTVRSDDPEEPFALPGDSGSLIVTEDGSAAVGLLFASSNPDGQIGWVCPLDTVLAELGGGLTLVTGH